MAHVGEKPHLCPEPNCEAAFSTNYHLKQHVYNWHSTEGQVRRKNDENRIRKVLEDAGFDFKAQHHIDFKCIGADREGDRCYIDFLVNVRDAEGKIIGIVFLEVDEDQHSWYEVSCELRRMTDTQRSLVLEGNTLPIMFIRYNPHGYKVDGVVRKNMWKKHREERLVEFIRTLTFTQPFGVTYMYYDTVEGKPAIFSDPAFEEAFKPLVTHCVV